jgi:4-hydroxy-3-polyprenylbenzoate decarboxylase
MDVLDHSCSKLGFGGKMCIDGTAKMEEETEPSMLSSVQVQWNKGLTEPFPDVTAVNVTLLGSGIPVLVVSVKKNRQGHIRELHQQLCNLRESDGLKMILYVEHTVDANDLTVALWRFCNNLDPKRDHMLVQRPSFTDPQKNFACMGLDGTIKTKAFDNFQRDWPNIIVSDEATIRAVDEKWNKLELGNFLVSPSLKFKGQMYGEEAVVNS